MRVLMLAQFYPPDIGGEEQHVRNLAHVLRARGNEVVVLTTHLPGTPRGIDLDEGITVRRVESSAQRVPGLYSSAARPHALPLADPRMARAISTAITEHRPDVVHAHNWIVNSALGPCRRAGVPVVLTLHDYSHVCAVKRLVRGGAVCEGPAPARCLACAARHYGPVIGAVTAVANYRSHQRREAEVAAFVAVSRSVAERNRLVTGGRRVEIIPNFVPDALVDDQAGPCPDGALLFVGDLVADKGVDVLLDAYARLRARPPLLLIGRDPAPARVLPEGAVALGPRSHEEVLTQMRAARAVVVPSLVADSCPTVVIEAMALGRPVVASASGGIVDLLSDGTTGVLVAPGDRGALAEAIEAVCGDQALASAIGSAGRAAVAPFTASVVAERLEMLYGQVTASSTAAYADGAGPFASNGGRRTRRSAHLL